MRRREGHSASDRLADHRTPFVFNEWYVAALSEEVDRTLSCRWLLGVNVLLYRKMDGSPVALENRCPHRSLPLSKGLLEGDAVVCGYHGLAFAPDGRCTRIPSQDHVPETVRARRFVVVERAPLVWIWMGPPDLADEARIPDLGWLSSPQYAHVRGYLHVGCNYIRLHENVLDVTHFPFVHGDAAGDIAYAQAPCEVTALGDQVRLVRVLADHPAPAGYAAAIGNHGHRVNRRSEIWFKTPALHVGHDALEDLDGGVGGVSDFHFTITHMFTPETPTSTHYFWAAARDVNIEDEALSTAGREFAAIVFQQDVELLEAIEQMWALGESDFREVSVAGDRAGLLMRRLIARRAHDEAEATPPPDF